MSVPESRELTSWKEVAAYLRVSVRTAQLWEGERNLPVRRLPGNGKSRILVSVEELENWKNQSAPDSVPAVPAARPWRHWIRWGVAVAILGTLALAVNWRDRPISSIHVAVEGIDAIDDRGGIVWHHAFENLDAPNYGDGERHSWIGDLDGDGRQEVLFVPKPAGILQEPVPLVCLNTKGQERWRFTPGKTVERGADVFHPPFVVRQFAMVGDKVIVTSHHHLYSPSQVAVLSKDGKLLREYWHPGHLNALTTGIYHGRPVAILGGVNNAARSATVVMLDPERLGGSAVENGVPVFRGMPESVEEARILLPRSCLNRQEAYNVVVRLHSNGDGIIADVHERLAGQDKPSVQYNFASDLSLARIVFSDIFVGAHSGAGHSLEREEEALRKGLRFAAGPRK